MRTDIIKQFNKVLFPAIATLFFVVFSVFVSANIVHAEHGGEHSVPTGPPCSVVQDVYGIPTWYKYLEGERSAGRCSPVIGGMEEALPIGLALFELALTFAGLAAVVMIFVGSFKYIISVGEPEKTLSARKTVINAIIGLGITIVATRVVAFVAGLLT